MLNIFSFGIAAFSDQYSELCLLETSNCFSVTLYKSLEKYKTSKINIHQSDQLY